MTNIVTSFNEIISYIEENLTEKLDYDEMGKIVGYSPYHLQRLFLLLSNIPISEYIRCRRLACSAHDLLSDSSSVTEVAYKYGYSSPASFSRAFKAFHGTTPKDIKRNESVIKAYPPLSFELTIKGAEPLDYRVTQMPGFRVIGKKIQTTMENEQGRQDIPLFWQETHQKNLISELLPFMNQQPFGVLGVSDYQPNLDNSAFDYYIGVASTEALKEDLHELLVPEATWACFKHPASDTPKELQEFQKKIVFDWLPTSGYEFTQGPDVEVYGQDNSVETWIPVKRIANDY
ncbi:AraC family transcriptional regulator [Enterococcus sp. AZ194]|uniref:AraC family transcriptional regulator n=1 Tax=Enterococcus sp. AZ194 TaxID=2774629 RepID=UPI003F212040